jgi:hypothetical protein
MAIRESKINSILSLYKKGTPKYTIARKLKLSWPTVNKYIKKYANNTMKTGGNIKSPSKFLLGKEITLTLPNSEKRKSQFAITDLDNVIASHNEETFSDSVGYPTNANGTNINDRNYKDDKAAQNEVSKYAVNLEPERIITTSRTPSGTPIVSDKGFVVSGNNRTMSLKLAAKKYPEKYREYIDFLREEAEAFGFKDSDITKIIIDKKVLDKKNSDLTFNGKNSYIDIKNPVLVRIDYDIPDLNTNELAKYNKDTKKAERPIDKAIKLSNILQSKETCIAKISDIIGQFETFSELWSDFPAQKLLAQYLMQCDLLTEQELPAYFSEGSFTGTGKEFVENILASIILDRDALISSEKEGVKRFKQIIITSLPVLIANNQLPEGKIIKSINEAIVIQYKIVSSGLDFQSYATQLNFIEEQPSKKAMYLNRLLSKGRNLFKGNIEKYNEAIISNQGESLFGDNKTVDEIFEFYIEAYVDGTDQKIIEAVSNPTVVEVETTEMSQQELSDLVEIQTDRAIELIEPEIIEPKENDPDRERKLKLAKAKAKARERRIRLLKESFARGGEIRSGEADTVERLEERIDSLQKLQEKMKYINKAHKSYKKDPSTLDKFDLTEQEINLIKTYVPKYSWEQQPFAKYQLTNNSQNINRLRKRLEAEKPLQKKMDNEDEEYVFDGGKITKSYADNNWIVYYDEIPDYETRSKIKGRGFKWNPKRYYAWARSLTLPEIYMPDLFEGFKKSEAIEKPVENKEWKPTEAVIHLADIIWDSGTINSNNDIDYQLGDLYIRNHIDNMDPEEGTEISEIYYLTTSDAKEKKEKIKNYLKLQLERWLFSLQREPNPMKEAPKHISRSDESFPAPMATINFDDIAFKKDDFVILKNGEKGSISNIISVGNRVTNFKLNDNIVNVEDVDFYKGQKVVREKTKEDNPESIASMTVNQFLEQSKKELGRDYSETMEGNIIDIHYANIEQHIKNGGKITQEVFDSLDSGKQYHFGRNYNHRGDKIEVKEKQELSKEEYESFDMSGYSYAIVKDGRVVTSGSYPLLGDKSSPMSKLGYYLNQAKTYGGELFIAETNKQPVDTMSSEELIIGKTWEQIQAMQQNKYVKESIKEGKIPEGAVLIEQYEEKPNEVSNASGTIKVEYLDFRPPSNKPKINTLTDYTGRSYYSENIDSYYTVIGQFENGNYQVYAQRKSGLNVYDKPKKMSVDISFIHTLKEVSKNTMNADARKKLLEVTGSPKVEKTEFIFNLKNYGKGSKNGKPVTVWYLDSHDMYFVQGEHSNSSDHVITRTDDIPNFTLFGLTEITKEQADSYLSKEGDLFNKPEPKLPKYETGLIIHDTRVGKNFEIISNSFNPDAKTIAYEVEYYTEDGKTHKTDNIFENEIDYNVEMGAYILPQQEVTRPVYKEESIDVRLNVIPEVAKIFRDLQSEYPDNVEIINMDSVWTVYVVNRNNLLYEFDSIKNEAYLLRTVSLQEMNRMRFENRITDMTSSLMLGHGGMDGLINASMSAVSSVWDYYKHNIKPIVNKEPEPEIPEEVEGFKVGDKVKYYQDDKPSYIHEIQKDYEGYKFLLTEEQGKQGILNVLCPPSQVVKWKDPERKDVILPIRTARLVKYLNEEKDLKKRAIAWNDGIQDEEGYDYVGSRGSIVRETNGKTLWQIAMRDPNLDVASSGSEEKVMFNGDELMRAIQLYSKNNNLRTTFKLPDEIDLNINVQTGEKEIEEIKEPVGEKPDINASFKNSYELNKAVEQLIDYNDSGNLSYAPEELIFINKYSGYGGLEKFGATGKGILYEYFTPDDIIKRMWALAYKYGYKGGDVLENSCGTGRFFRYLPKDAKAVGYEINKYSNRICQLLYPNVEVNSETDLYLPYDREGRELKTHFDTLFIKNRISIRNKTKDLRKFDLVIGNPPYGRYESRHSGFGEKQFTKASNYIDYFITRGLDLLNSGGLLIYIIGAEVAAGGTPFLDQQMSGAKKAIIEKSDLLDAYRLPNGVFDKTDVLTDIICLRKK